MQNRMKNHALTDEEMDALLQRALVGRLCTINGDGTPYAVPIHFVHLGGNLYTHGLPAGQKLENLARNPLVCFEVDEMVGVLTQGVENPCGTNTEFSSVILRGEGALLTDPLEKRSILSALVQKYTPQLHGRELPEKAVRETAVLEICVTGRTGKYYRP